MKEHNGTNCCWAVSCLQIYSALVTLINSPVDIGRTVGHL